MNLFCLSTATLSSLVQIKRMFATLGFEVEELHRHSIGGFTLGDLPEGEWRFATPEDLEAVFSGAEVVLDAPTTPSTSSSSSRPEGGAVASTSGRNGSSTSPPHVSSSSSGKEDVVGLEPRRSNGRDKASPVVSPAASPGGAAGESWAAGLLGEELVLGEDEEAGDRDGSLQEEQSSTSKRYRDSLKFKRRRTQLRQRVLKGSS
jgi:hypothetical protein